MMGYRHRYWCVQHCPKLQDHQPICGSLVPGVNPIESLAQKCREIFGQYADGSEGSCVTSELNHVRARQQCWIRPVEFDIFMLSKAIYDGKDIFPLPATGLPLGPRVLAICVRWE